MKQMDWDRLLSVKRLGMEEWKPGDALGERSQFQRDYDRIIFSSPFRRMQNKTQVFPLPDHIFVHNRLTHSLEVASVGRSFGNLIADFLMNERKGDASALVPEIGAVVSAACLAHDMGNPPFGHSGESAISGFFRNGPGSSILSEMEEAEQNDFLWFDGNANAFRLLTHQFRGKRPGGFALTYSTLASIVKYPFESAGLTKSKFGFFRSEREIYLRIAGELGLPVASENPLAGTRHPLVYFVEAADDICYQIMDLEDACRLGIMSYDQVKGLYLTFYDQQDDHRALESINKTLRMVDDPNEQISYLRSGLIGKLIQLCFANFRDNIRSIESGQFKGSLLGTISGITGKALKEVKEVSFSSVYNHRSVVEIEIAGYKIISTLLEEFTGAVLNQGNPYYRKISSLLPQQFQTESSSVYHKVQSVVDFISGMTDNFALDLYRKIKGINIPGVG